MLILGGAMVQYMNAFRHKNFYVTVHSSQVIWSGGYPNVSLMSKYHLFYW